MKKSTLIVLNHSKIATYPHILTLFYQLDRWAHLVHPNQDITPFSPIINSTWQNVQHFEHNVLPNIVWCASTSARFGRWLVGFSSTRVETWLGAELSEEKELTKNCHWARIKKPDIYTSQRMSKLERHKEADCWDLSERCIAHRSWSSKKGSNVSISMETRKKWWTMTQLNEVR